MKYILCIVWMLFKGYRFLKRLRLFKRVDKRDIYTVNKTVMFQIQPSLHNLHHHNIQTLYHPRTDNIN